LLFIPDILHEEVLFDLLFAFACIVISAAPLLDELVLLGLPEVDAGALNPEHSIQHGEASDDVYLVNFDDYFNSRELGVQGF
jgi:hypothetical protein